MATPERANDAEQVRTARTESLFRELNERIAQNAERFESEHAEFVCECGDTACTHRVEASLETYETVREHATRFLLAPGHCNDRVERVFGGQRRHEVVEKAAPAAAATARTLDPRASAA